MTEYYKLLNGSEVLDEFDNPMNWDQIRTLYNEGHDMESHGMQHRYLRNLSSQDLVHEISESKACLENQGLNPTYFQIPSNRGADNVTILKTISKYFDFGLSGHSKLMFLNCDGWINHSLKQEVTSIKRIVIPTPMRAFQPEPINMLLRNGRMIDITLIK